MEYFNETGVLHTVARATLNGPGAVNSSTPQPRIPGPGDPPIKHPMVVIYMIVVVGLIVFASLIWRGVHKDLMKARATRLTPDNLEHTHKTTSLWLKLVKFAWIGFKAIFMAFLSIFTKTFWEDLWDDTKQTFSPLSACGICLNAYSCGLICNPDTDDDEPLPVTEKSTVVVAQSSMTMPETSDLQQTLPAVVVEELV